jgi:dCTP deaminase
MDKDAASPTVECSQEVGELSDSEVVAALLNREIVITPLLSVRQFGMTVDLRLGTLFGVRNLDKLTHFDPVTFRESQSEGSHKLLRYYDISKRIDPTEPFILHPGRFVLGCTLEYVILRPNISGVLEGRSGWAREGLNVHSTASFIHPGHSGSIVFELSNVGSHPLPLYPGTRVAQIRFTRHRYANAAPYGSRSEDKYGSAVRRHDAPASAARQSKSTTGADSRLTMFGRPWQDWEFERIADEKDRRAALAQAYKRKDC